MTKVNVGIVGATGMVGQTIREVLEERNFPVNEIHFFASENSKGNLIKFNGKDVEVEVFDENNIDDSIDIFFLAAGGDFSEAYAKKIVDSGAYVIDNSSFFRMEEDVPLVIPEVNADSIGDSKLISNPNCSTIQSVLALKPLYDAYGLKRVIYSTYQSVSGSGVAGIRDLEEGTTDNYPYPISSNTLPHIDDFLENGYTKEEMKMIDETKKILSDQDIRLTATTVRVPIKNSHAVSINAEFEKPFEIEDVFEIYSKADGIVLKDDVENLQYPIQSDTNGKDEVYVGRIRRDFSVDNGVNIWCMADNIRKGAATNTVQIAEAILDRF